MTPSEMSTEQLLAATRVTEAAERMVMEGDDYVCALLRELADRLEAAIATATAFVDRVDEIENSDAVRGVYTIAMVHGMRYAGPNWSGERDALRAVLKAVSGEGGGE